MAVSRDDRDVSFALVISGCLGTARGQCESSGVTGQTTLPALEEGGLAGWTRRSKKIKSPWKLAWHSF